MTRLYQIETTPTVCVKRFDFYHGMVVFQDQLVGRSWPFRAMFFRRRTFDRRRGKVDLNGRIDFGVSHGHVSLLLLSPVEVAATHAKLLEQIN